VHERYLRPLATHREVMIVTLNHLDEVPHGQRAALLTDLRRLLEAEGLTGVPVLGTSARDGDGIAELRSLVAEKVRTKKAAAARLTADGETRQGLLDAVRWHTMGSATWTRTGLALYMADFLEPGRNFSRADRAFLARLVPTDFDGVLRQVVRARIEWALREGHTLFPGTIELWNDVR